ncbi:hypothetical protein K7X08_029272 [Anisodus acutangulus]|uniref:Uncharacterized protein n=1 Tax=Anisodus acutangulus TaxID=402998 RepID=A0A9Q1L1R7_9SOLA|nr:hypothetical protein K7X08_029272 [Anisodus acutangulus]
MQQYGVELIDLMMQSNCDVVGHWIETGKKEQPKHLIRLLKIVKSSPGFREVYEFDQAQIPSLDSEEPPNCWALPVVTLTSIAIALPDIDFHSIKELIRWLDIDLRKTATEGQNPKAVLEGRRSECFFKGIKWPTNMLAANCMYRVCQTLLQNSDSKEFENSKIMFDRLSTMIADITGACLTNVQRVISMQCHHGTIEERAEGVRSAVLLLGKAECFGNSSFTGSQPLPSSAPDQWRTHSKEVDYL